MQRKNGFVMQWTRKCISPTADTKSYYIQLATTYLYIFFLLWPVSFWWTDLLGKFSRHAKYYTTEKMQRLRKFTLFWILISKGRRAFESPLWAEHLFFYHISKHLTFRAEQSIGDQPSNWGVKTSKASSCIWKHVTTITERKQLYLLS